MACGGVAGILDADVGTSEFAMIHPRPARKGGDLRSAYRCADSQKYSVVMADMSDGCGKSDLDLAIC